MVSFELEGQNRAAHKPVREYRVVTSSLIVGQKVFRKGDIIKSTEIDMDLSYYTGLRLVELVDDEGTKKKGFFQRLFSR